MLFFFYTELSSSQQMNAGKGYNSNLNSTERCKLDRAAPVANQPNSYKNGDPKQWCGRLAEWHEAVQAQCVPPGTEVGELDLGKAGIISDPLFVWQMKGQVACDGHLTKHATLPCLVAPSPHTPVSKAQ